MIFKRKHQRKIQPLLIMVILITMGILTAAFLSARRSQGPPSTNDISMDPEATLSIEGVQMTTTRDGKTAWNLTAKTGNYLDQRRKAMFNHIAATFYTDEGQQVHLTADEGTYNSGSNDLEVSGNVVLKNNQYQMETRYLVYDHGHRMFTSDNPVTVHSDGASLTATSMAYNLRTDQIILNGNFSGSIRDDIVL